MTNRNMGRAMDCFGVGRAFILRTPFVCAFFLDRGTHRAVGAPRSVAEPCHGPCHRVPKGGGYFFVVPHACFTLSDLEK